MNIGLDIDKEKDELRVLFSKKYPDVSKITQTDLHKLVYLIDKQLDIHYANGHLRMYMEPINSFVARMIRTTGIQYRGIELKVNAHYFSGRQAIDIINDGRVYFCGGASGINHVPFLIAFAEWVE